MCPELNLRPVGRRVGRWGEGHLASEPERRKKGEGNDDDKDDKDDDDDNDDDDGANLFRRDCRQPMLLLLPPQPLPLAREI